jgi:hypothetical protein
MPPALAGFGSSLAAGSRFGQAWTVDVIRLDASLAAGCYLVRGRSSTVWVLDWRPPLQAYVVRVRGDGSPTDSVDGRWVPLVSVAGIDPDTGVSEPAVIRVGRRHRWTTNPGTRTGWSESWVVQSRCTGIEPIPRNRAEALLTETTGARTADDRR